MSDEALRALEKNWRSLATDIRQAGGGGCSNAKATERERCADELAILIAELGQEVGAVTNEMVLAAADAFLMHPGCVDQTVGHGPIRAALEAAFTSPAHTSEARDADAARYAFLRDSVACSLSISHNDHHNMYMSVADTFDSTDGYYNDIGNDERAKMIETDTIWTLHVYPNTPVGFNVYHGSSLDAVCDAAMRQEAGSRE